jgi:AraC-like DNA-binding protein
VKGNFFIIPSMFKHQLISGSKAVFVFVEPTLYFSKTHKQLMIQLSSQYQYIADLIKRTMQAIDSPGASWFKEIDTAFKDKTRSQERLMAVVSYIHEHIHSSLQTKAIAGHIALSESRLQHLFKESFGMPIRSYIHWQRLKMSAQAIIEGSTLTAAAYQGGFADSAHFTRTFTQMFGMTPSNVFKK